MFTFSSYGFVIAGGVAAAAVAAIHLWQRTRPRPLEWGAMDFLMQAVAQRRTWLRLRDLLLMLVRCLCVLLVGLALAEPSSKNNDRTAETHVPVHAVFLLDNSLSMAEGSGTGVRLDAAKAKAHEIAARFAAGSRFTAIALCASQNNHLIAADANLSDFREAIQRVDPVDARLRLTEVAAQAALAAGRLKDWPLVVVALGDQQAINFSPADIAQWTADTPVYWIESDQAAPDNSTVVDLQLQEPILKSGGTCHLTAQVAHWGTKPRDKVQVTASVDGVDVASRVVDLAANQTTAVPFVFSLPVTGGPRKTDTILQVRIAPDDVPEDDIRYRWVPLRERIPILLIDQYGETEDPRTNRFGETYPLRRLLATRTSENSASLFEIRHRAMANFNVADLDGVAMVIVAGTAGPGALATELTDYVRGGGLLWIAAGGEFSPSMWNSAGSTMLPRDMTWGELAGALPSDPAQAPRIRRVDLGTCSSQMLDLPGLSRSQATEILGQPVFFRTVVAEPVASGNKPPADSEPIIWARYDDGSPLLIEQPLGNGTLLWMTTGMFPEWNTLSLGNGLILLEQVFNTLLSQAIMEENWSTMTPIEITVPGALLESHYLVTLPGGRTLPVARGGRTLVIPPVTQRGIVTVGQPGAASGEAIARVVVNGPTEESDLRQLTSEQLTERWQSTSLQLVDSIEQIKATRGQSSGRSWWRWLLIATAALLLLELGVLAYSGRGDGGPSP